MEDNNVFKSRLFGGDSGGPEIPKVFRDLLDSMYAKMSDPISQRLMRDMRRDIFGLADAEDASLMALLTGAMVLSSRAPLDMSRALILGGTEFVLDQAKKARHPLDQVQAELLRESMIKTVASAMVGTMMVNAKLDKKEKGDGPTPES